MPQLSLYLDDPMMEGLRQDASREGKTLSKFVAGVLKDHAENNRWPHGFFIDSKYLSPSPPQRSPTYRSFPFTFKRNAD